MDGALERLEQLTEKYRGMIEDYKLSMEALERAREITRTMEALWPVAASSLEARGIINEARRRIREERYGEALSLLGEACRRLMREWLRRYGIEADFSSCPEPGEVEALEKLMEAAGPTKPIVASILYTNSYEEYRERLARLLEDWPRLAESLSKLYTAAYMLEKQGLLDVRSMVEAEAERLRSLEGYEERVESLLRAAEEAYTVARRLEKARRELEEAERRARGLPDRLWARVARELEELRRLEAEARKTLSLAKAAGAPAASKIVMRVAEKTEGITSKMKLAALLASAAGSKARASAEELAIIEAVVMDDVSSLADLIDRLKKAGMSEDMLLRAVYRLCSRGELQCILKPRGLNEARGHLGG